MGFSYYIVPRYLSTYQLGWETRIAEYRVWAYRWCTVDPALVPRIWSEIESKRPLWSRELWAIYEVPPSSAHPDKVLHSNLPATRILLADDAPLGHYPDSTTSLVFATTPVTYGRIAVAYYLGEWPEWDDYQANPNDPAIWPPLNLYGAVWISRQKDARSTIDSEYARYAAWKKMWTPAGYIPAHYIQEVYYLDRTKKFPRRSRSVVLAEEVAEKDHRSPHRDRKSQDSQPSRVVVTARFGRGELDATAENLVQNKRRRGILTEEASS